MNKIKSEAIARFWASLGYTVVIQGTHGRYESGGTYYPLVSERKDGIETLSWISRQPWYNGKIGMWGGSAFGYTQWAIADQINPGISVFDIQICSTDLYGMFYPGSAFSLESALFWTARSRGKVDVDPSLDDLEKGYKGFPLVEADDRAVGDAASLMCCGVSKSGSPAPSPMMSLPSALSFAARAVTASVGEGLMACTRVESDTVVPWIF